MSRWNTGLILFAVAALAVAGAAFALAPKSDGTDKEGIVWTDFEQGSEYALKNDLPVMIYFSTKWCGWCRKLERDVYTVPEVVEMSKKFVNIRIDGDQSKELTMRYKVRGYPTIIFTDSDSEEVARIPGFAPAAPFLERMKAALEQMGIDTTRADKEPSDG